MTMKIQLEPSGQVDSEHSGPTEFPVKILPGRICGPTNFDLASPGSHSTYGRENQVHSDAKPACFVPGWLRADARSIRPFGIGRGS
jgi:hypothetical protein